MKAKVCHISTAHISTDTRIFHKECGTLSRAGYDVVYVVPDVESRETQNGVKIAALNQYTSRLNRIVAGTRDAFLTAKIQRAEIYHFHDPELIPAGLLLRLLGNKVIYDVHEDVPKQILDKTWLGPRLFRALIAGAVRGLENFSCLFFTGIVAATPDIGKRFPHSKTVVVHNFPELRLIDHVKAASYKSTCTTLIYAGSLAKIRGIGELISAVGKCESEVKLLLMGNWEEREFEAECMELDGWRRTEYLGHKSLEEVFGFYHVADIGLHMIHPIPRYLVGIPTKILECMAFKMPVIMTESEYWKDFFGTSARFADALDSSDIAKQIDAVVSDPELAERMGDTGRDLVERKYSWEADIPKLLGLYERILT